jgi:hypothetical protein
MALHKARPGIGRPPDKDDHAAQGRGELSEQRAKEICDHMGATHADRETHQWMPRRTENGWQVVKIALPPPGKDLIAETRADERPEVGDDPRSSGNRNIGGGGWAG